MTLALNQFLVLYSWFVLVALLLVVLLIARFYRKFSGKSTFHNLYFLPLTLFGAAAVRYASVGGVSGDLWGDLCSGAGGLALLVLLAVLYHRMVYRVPR